MCGETLPQIKVIPSHSRRWIRPQMQKLIWGQESHIKLSCRLGDLLLELNLKTGKGASISLQCTSVRTIHQKRPSAELERLILSSNAGRDSYCTASGNNHTLPARRVNVEGNTLRKCLSRSHLDPRLSIAVIVHEDAIQRDLHVHCGSPCRNRHSPRCEGRPRPPSPLTG